MWQKLRFALRAYTLRNFFLMRHRLSESNLGTHAHVHTYMHAHTHVARNSRAYTLTQRCPAGLVYISVEKNDSFFF